MAEALLGVVCENLLSMIQNEFATISGIKEKAERLSSTLHLIKAVLEDAEEKQITNRSVKVWLQQVKDAAYVADDILDECSIQSNRLRGLTSLKPKNIRLGLQIGRKLKEITERFDQIAEDKKRLLLQEGVRERSCEVAEWRETSSAIAQPRVYGRDEDKEKIVEFLLIQAQGSDFLSIYPIVGLGGIGKTTLAQVIYNDDRVSSHFNMKIWVCVSENFSVKRILCSIIESLTEKYDGFVLDVIQKKVQKLLQGKRYLLVLDDVWKTSEELEFGLTHGKWNELKSVLSCGFKGASILVSTRDKEVAAIMGTCQAHHLLGLSDGDCWSLFKQYAFGSDKEECQELVAIGKEIVKKCAGSPLAAQALGSLLHSKSEEKEWFNVKESRLWDLQDEKSILPALRLSYFYLTPTLKQCFAFCAIFEKDEKIHKEELIHLWMANGFISSRESLEVEEVGNRICKELYQKSLFQDVRQYKNSGDIFFKMHDLVHDLAQSVAGQECLIWDNANSSNLSKGTHHIRSNFILSPFNKQALQIVESLRTAYDACKFKFQNSNIYFPTNSSLRVLRTRSFEFSSLESLIHLRYLELFRSETKSLPDSICSLQKLEILKLSYCTMLSCLPKHLSCLQNLRHLVIRDCLFLSRMFPGIGNLSCLRTLNIYIVGSERGHSLAELHHLKLIGKLHIQGLKCVTSSNEAERANLGGKKDLEELCLAWHTHETKSRTATYVEQEQVLERLQPHSNLKILRIHSFEGLNMPRWMGFLNSLDTLEFSGCKNCLQLPSLGKLPNLRKLYIVNKSNIEYMDDDECYDGVEMMAFPSLEVLILHWLPELKSLLKMEKGNMCPRLSDLCITCCPKLGLSYLPSIKRLTCDGLYESLLSSISSHITSLTLFGSGDNTITSFPEGTMRNFTSLKTLKIVTFHELRELPDELFLYFQALETLSIESCDKLECLPEGVWEGLCSLRSLEIRRCGSLKWLPEGIRQLTSLEILHIEFCGALIERCKEVTGEDWDKVAHVPKLILLPPPSY